MKRSAGFRWFGSSILLLITALTILSLCVWQTLKLGTHKSLTTDFALTLTRLAHWQTDVATDQDFTADGAAQLVAVGDVQSEAIALALSEVPIGRFKDSGGELLSHWQRVRSAFTAINVSPVIAEPEQNVSNGQVIGLTAALQSYESLFDAIVSESLSKPLLTLASEIRGRLLGLEILVIAGLYSDQTQLVVSELRQLSEQMHQTVRPANGPAILGYQSSLKLEAYRTAIEALTITESLPDNRVSLSVSSPSDLSLVTGDALLFTRSLLQAIEVEQQGSRRNVLLALLLSSLCLLLVAGIGWSVRRNSAVSAEPAQPLYPALQHDLSRLAEGDYSHKSTVVSNHESAAAVATAFNAVTESLSQRQRRFTDMLKQSSVLASQQQAVVESLEARLAELSQRNKQQTSGVAFAVKEVDQLIHALTEQDEAQQSEVHWQLADAVADTAASLARVTAQLDLSNGRITRAVERVQNLQGAVGQIESQSRRSNLQALNESIKLVGYYDTNDQSDRFIERTQRISHQLQVAAEGASRSANEIFADLQACSDALKECLTAAQESAQNALRSNRMLKASVNDPATATQVRQLEQIVQQLSAVFSEPVPADEKSPEEELLYIKGHALELQLLAAEASQSIAESEEVQIDAQ